MKKATFLVLIIFGMMVNTVRSQSISDLLEGYCAYNRFWGNILVTQNGKTVFQKNYGFADWENNIKNNESKLFSLASVTKAITATAIFKLHDEGKLSVYDRVDKYIPGFINDNTDSLTILNLLNHTSGMIANLAHSDDMSKEETKSPGSELITLEQLIDSYRGSRLKSKPGKRWDYNNYGYILLAYIIEKVSGTDYMSYMNQAIFAETGMNKTCNQMNLPKEAATGYFGVGTDSIYPVANETHPSWLVGAAGLYSTTSDLGKFLRAVFSHQLFSEKTLHLMLDTCVITNRGKLLWTAGWQKDKIDGQEFFSHSGSIQGFSTLIGYMPEKDISIIILSNLVKDYAQSGMSSKEFSYVEEIAGKVINIMDNNIVSCLPVPRGKPSKKHVGNYKLDDTHSVNLSLENDFLILSTEPESNFTLFDYTINREISDTSNNYNICKIFTATFVDNNFNDFGKYATEEMQTAIFHEKGFTGLMNFREKVIAQTGKYLSTNICKKITMPGRTDYILSDHFEGSDMINQLSFNDEGKINGFFILKLLPKCNVNSVKLIPTGDDVYFIDGYKNGGFDDFMVRYDKANESLTFESKNESFTALKIGNE